MGIALTLTPCATNANNGSVTWSYDLADNQFDFLAAGEALVLTYTATVNDGQGGIVTTPVTVTIHGTNDVPTIAPLTAALPNRPAPATPRRIMPVAASPLPMST